MQEHTPFWHNTTHQFINEVVHRLSSLDQQDDPPGLLQLGHHVLERLCSNHLGAFCLILQKVMHLGDGPVVSTDLLDRFGEIRVEKKKKKRSMEWICCRESDDLTTKPWSFMFMMRFWPITAKPISAMSAL